MKICSERILLTVILCLVIIDGFCQTPYPKDYFQSPLFLPLDLAGNFGEIRSGHFHSGIDIRTNEQEGQVLMAAADGYISRIKVSAYGFGKAIYIDHPNGFTTVYGHLHHFSDTISALVEAEQYKRKSFEVDISYDSLFFPVVKGQLIGFSGNTGGSEGPHLHFEIRDTRSEHPLNPLLFGFVTQDSVPPVIRNIKIYQVTDFENGFITDTAFNVAVNDSEKISSLQSDTIIVSGKIAFGVECSDRMDNLENEIGINKIELLIDGKTIYTYHFNEFSFDETRFVNANIDYAEKINDSRKFILLFHQPGNLFSMALKDTLAKGFVLSGNDGMHEAEIRVADFNGNTTVKKLWLMNAKRKENNKKQIPRKFISDKKAPLIMHTDIKISFPAHPVTYNCYPFELKKEKKLRESFSPVYTIADETIPVHTYMNVSIKPVHLPQALFSKALIVAVDKYGKISAEESKYADGWVTGKVRHFGKFTVAIDTTAPVITPMGTVTDTILYKNKIVFTIGDNLSGIKSYLMKLNDEWVLAEYDAKTGSLFYMFKDIASEKNFKITVEVIDRKENKAVFEAVY